jgi:hypothetical protein
VSSRNSLMTQMSQERVQSISGRLSRVAYKSPVWYMHFHRSMHACHDAGQRLHSLDSACISDMETYVNLQRNVSGLRMVFHLIEHAGGLDVPEWASSHVLKQLTDHACDLITWSEVRACAKHILGINVCSRTLSHAQKAYFLAHASTLLLSC